MSERIFTESEIEAFALLFLTGIRKMVEVEPLKNGSHDNIFSELEDYLYNVVMSGYPILYIRSKLIDVIPQLGIDEGEASLFASYVGYCLLRRSDEDAIKKGIEPMNELDLLVQFRKEKYAFQLRERKLGPTLLSQDVVEILNRWKIKIPA
jgi:hypothetical protein